LNYETIHFLMPESEYVDTSSMKWYFPIDSSIREVGANSLKFDTPDDSVKMFVRELCQNSSDASAGGKVRIEFQLYHIKSDHFPDKSGFKTVLDRCVRTASGYNNDRTAYDLLKEMRDRLDAPEITVLRASDFGTKGAQGSRVNFENTPWKSMTIAQGISDKGQNSGGSFGRGKESFFSVSEFHTVFFSTNAIDGYNASIGCSDLITHHDDDRLKYAPFGICGDSNFKGNYSVPGILKTQNYTRPVNEYGTDVYIMGYTMVSDDWDDRILLSVIKDFFVQIARDQLEVIAGEKKVDSNNLMSCLEKYSKKFTDDTSDLRKIIEQTAMLSSEPYYRNEIFSLYLKRTDFNGGITSIRSGMVIDRDYLRSATALGLLIIDDQKSSRMLSKSEPTNHDKWVKSNLQNLSSSQRKDISRLINQISKTVKESVSEFEGAGYDETADAEGLDKYIPLHQNSNDDVIVARKEYNWGPIAEVKPRKKKKVRKRKESEDPPKTGSEEMTGTEEEPDDEFEPTGATNRGERKRGDAERNFNTDENGDMTRVFKISPRIRITDVHEACSRAEDGDLKCRFIFNINSASEHYIRVSAMMRGGKSAEQLPLKRVVRKDGSEVPIIDGFHAGPIIADPSGRNELLIVVNYPAICDFRLEVVEHAD